MDRPLGSRTSVIVAAEQGLFGDGLGTLLKSSRRFLVVHNTSDGVEALQRTRELRPDVLVLDLAVLPERLMSPELGASLPPTALVVLTPALARSAVQPLIDLGTRGVILKNARAGLLVRAIGEVVAGKYWVDREQATDFPEALHRLAARQRRRTYGLTDRESEIVAAVAAAYSNKDIAQRFDISETTVKHHLTNIFDKIGVSTRLELAMFAVSSGFQAGSLTTLMQ
jgi:DNA-binding NarL/FixJ family response regulator